MNSPPSKAVLILPEEQEGSGSGHHRSSGRRTSTDTAFYTCPPLPDQFCARREFQNEFGGTRGTTRLALSDFFDHGKSLGEGGFGSVVLCEELSTKFRCVIKKVDRSTVIEDGMTQILAQEIESMHKLQQHPNIVQLLTHFQDPVSRELCLVIEYCEGSNLHEYLYDVDRITEKETFRIIQGITQGLLHCHKHGVYHFDLKTDNILIGKNEEVKIVDFGASIMSSVPTQKLMEIVGTEQFFPPELQLWDQDSKILLGAVDVWGLGCIMFEIIFDDEDFSDWQKKAKAIQWKEDTKLPAPHGDYVVSSEVLDLIAQCLRVDPYKRLELKTIYSHSWFTKFLPPGESLMGDKFSQVKVDGPVLPLEDVSNRIIGSFSKLPCFFKQHAITEEDDDVTYV